MFVLVAQVVVPPAPCRYLSQGSTPLPYRNMWRALEMVQRSSFRLAAHRACAGGQAPGKFVPFGHFHFSSFWRLHCGGSFSCSTLASTCRRLNHAGPTRTKTPPKDIVMLHRRCLAHSPGHRERLRWQQQQSLLLYPAALYSGHRCSTGMITLRTSELFQMAKNDQFIVVRRTSDA